jgi:hypothetical protein
MRGSYELSRSSVEGHCIEGHLKIVYHLIYFRSVYDYISSVHHGKEESPRKLRSRHRCGGRHALISCIYLSDLTFAGWLGSYGGEDSTSDISRGEA